MTQAFASAAVLVLACFASASHASEQTVPPPISDVPPPVRVLPSPPPALPSPLPPPAPPPSVPRSGDPCQADVTELDGVVTLAVQDPARAGTSTLFTLGNRRYAARFDSAGQLHARAPMFSPTADMEWIGAEDRTCRRYGVIFRNFKSVVMTAIVWSGPYDLALRVKEPGGHIVGSVNDAHPGQINNDHTTTRGDFETFGEAGTGETRVQLYTLQAERNPRQGEISYFVEFVSRGNPARAPYCGEDQKAIAEYRLVHIDSKTLAKPYAEARKFQAVACGTTWTEDNIEDGYLMRWKWKL